MLNKIIKTIDLWTEQFDNQYECFNACFIDGFDSGDLPFNSYKVVKNCNCKISVSSANIHITNKHNAIIFYKNKKPVRLAVINKNTDVDKCISIALSQVFKADTLGEFYKQSKIKAYEINLKQKPVYNKADKSKEIDVGSCDRWNLLFNMLKGSYTESETVYGNYQSDKYEFIPNLKIKYELEVEDERYELEHECAFINSISTRLIPIQKDSSLTKNK